MKSLVKSHLHQQKSGKLVLYCVGWWLRVIFKKLGGFVVMRSSPRYRCHKFQLLSYIIKKV